jgi:opacity protein-like surface antigen
LGHHQFETAQENAMFMKSLIATAAIAASAAVFVAAPATAKTNFDFNVVIGDGGFGHYDGGYSYYEPRYPRRHRFDDEGDFRISCGRGSRVVRRAGFRNVEAYDCSAPVFGYTAMRHGDLFKVKVNSRGNIISVREIH